tara:strand:+ start:155 stop:1867 length:1713 start_codon:yes stop_codon:yes gene_type:complete
MDETGSPIGRGIRGIRRMISSSFFGVPRQSQNDSITNDLLTQQSLKLTLVSGQLQNISKQLTVLDFNLQGIKNNLAISDRLDRQREAERLKRNRILAEQGLREGKESELEKKIQTALFKPIQRIAVKTRGILERLTKFLFTLAGGWLAVTGIDLLQAMSEGNVEKINKLKTKFFVGLGVITGSLTVISIGIKKTIGILGVFAGNLARVAFGGILKSSLRGVQNLLGVLIRKAGKIRLGSGGVGGTLRGIINSIIGGAAGVGVYTEGQRLAEDFAKEVEQRKMKADENIKLRESRRVEKKIGETIDSKVKVEAGGSSGASSGSTKIKDNFFNRQFKKIRKLFSPNIKSTVNTGKNAGFLKNLNLGRLLKFKVPGPLEIIFTALGFMGRREEGQGVAQSATGSLAETTGGLAGFKLFSAAATAFMVKASPLLAGGPKGGIILLIGSLLAGLIGAFFGSRGLGFLNDTIYKQFKIGDFNKKVKEEETFLDIEKDFELLSAVKEDKSNTIDQISQFEEGGGTDIIDLNAGSDNQNVVMGGQVDQSKTNQELPTIAFNNNNPHTMYATSLTGVGA